MSDNPFQAPAAEMEPAAQSLDFKPAAPGEVRKTPDELREIATWQRWVLWSLLARILLVVPVFLLAEEVRPVLLIVSSLIALAAVYPLFKLTRTFYSTGVSVLFMIGGFLPGIFGLVVLLIVNQKTSELLNRHGIRVGLMGVPPSQIPG